MIVLNVEIWLSLKYFAKLGIWSLETKSMETSETYLSEHVRTTILTFPCFWWFLRPSHSGNVAGKVLQPLI